MVAAIVLHEHRFSAVGHAYTIEVGRRGVRHLYLWRTYVDPTQPLWKDALALVLASGAVAVAALIAGRLRRVALAVAVTGGATAGAVYLYQSAVFAHPCPGPFCPSEPVSHPGFWSHPASVAIIAAGAVITALLIRRPASPARSGTA